MAKVFKTVLRALKYLLWDIYYYAVTFFHMLLNKKKLAVLYVYADSQRYPKAHWCLHRLVKRLRGFEITLVRIDNFDEQKQARQEDHNVYDIAGDNRYWEFSGWKKGLAFLEAKHIEPDLIIFVNDAFLNFSKRGQDYRYYKSRISTLTLRRLKDSVLGFIDSYNEFDMLLGYDVSSWIRTNLFVVPYGVARQLGFPLIADEVIREMLPETYSGKIFKENHHINPTLKRFLEFWITEDWHLGRPVNRENWAFLRAKLIAILNERLLTAKLRELSVQVVNMDTISVL